MDSLIGNVINSVQIDSSYDEDLHCIEQAVACTIVGSDINIYVRVCSRGNDYSFEFPADLSLWQAIYIVERQREIHVYVMQIKCSTK